MVFTYSQYLKNEIERLKILQGTSTLKEFSIFINTSHEYLRVLPTSIWFLHKDFTTLNSSELAFLLHCNFNNAYDHIISKIPLELQKHISSSSKYIHCKALLKNFIAIVLQNNQTQIEQVLSSKNLSTLTQRAYYPDYFYQAYEKSYLDIKSQECVLEIVLSTLFLLGETEKERYFSVELLL